MTATFMLVDPPPGYIGAITFADNGDYTLELTPLGDDNQPIPYTPTDKEWPE